MLKNMRQIFVKDLVNYLNYFKNSFRLLFVGGYESKFKAWIKFP